MHSQVKFAFDISWSLFSQLITMGMGLLINVILGRWLGAEEFGLFTMALTLYMCTVLVAGLGIPQAIVKYVAEFKDERRKMDIYISSAILNSLILGVFSGLIIFVLSNTFAEIFQMTDLSSLLKIIALAVPLLLVNNTILGILNGLREMKSYSLRSVLRSILLFSFTTIFVFYGFGAMGAVFSILITDLIVLLFLFNLSKKFFTFTVSNFLGVSREIIIFGLLIFAASAIFMLNIYADTILLGYFMSATEVGIYFIAVTIARSGFLVLPSAISAVTYPAISEYYSKGFNKGIEIIINKAFKYNLIILSILGIFIIFFSENIILLILNPEYLPATLPLNILIFGMIFFGPLQSIGSVMTAMNRPDITAINNIIVIVINISLNILLIPLFGMAGAAISSAISLVTLTFLAIFQFRRLFDINVDVFTIFKVFLSLCGILTVYFVGINWVSEYALILFLLGIYIGYLYHSIFSIEERDEIFRLAGLYFNR